MRPFDIPAEQPLVLAGKAVETGAYLEVTDPWTGGVVARVHRAGPEQVEAALAAAHAARPAMAALPTWKRVEILHRAADRVAERAETFTDCIVAEAGKPRVWAAAEVQRAVATFRTAAEEASRMYGEVLPLDLGAAAAGRTGLTRLVPAGPVVAISPFNFPLNLACHKLAPAVAAGCPVILKPSSLTPVTGLLLGRTLVEAGLPAGLPPGAVSVLPMAGAQAEALVADPRPATVSFTGSPEVGWGLKARAGRKRVLLELGGNAGAIVHHDADLDDAATRLVTGAFAYAGQVCISTQRIFVHDSVADAFLERLVAGAQGLQAGDPDDQATRLGPMIDDTNAARVQEWIGRACAAGGRVRCGGGRQGRMVEATVLTDVPRDQDVVCREAFGPVVVVESYDDPSAALDAVNDSPYGLQAGLFTRDMDLILEAFERLEVGGIMVNDAPHFRVDPMPYGGVKQSGFGREGLRWAMREMSELRLLVLRKK